MIITTVLGLPITYIEDMTKSGETTGKTSSLGTEILGYLLSMVRKLLVGSYILGWIIIAAALIDQEIFYDVHMSQLVAGVYDKSFVSIGTALVVFVLSLCGFRIMSIVAAYQYQRMFLRKQPSILLKQLKTLH